MSETVLMFISVVSFIFATLGLGLAFMGSWLGFGLCMSCIVIFIISEHKLNR